MTAYLGRPGSFDALTVSSPMPIGVAGQVRSVMTLGGRRVAQLPVARSRRVWTVSRNAALPREWAVWQEYADGLWGAGPHTFVDPWTQVTNVLTREQSLGVGWSGSTFKAQTGRLTLPDGARAPGWLQRDGTGGTSTLLAGTPVVAGLPVTLAVWAERASSVSSVSLTANFRDATDSIVGSPASVSESVAGWHHLMVSAVAPVGAATVQITVIGVATVAVPQVTWTNSTAHGWVVGQSAQVVVSGGSHAPIIATHDVALTAGSVTVTEVG